ncbi:hypothetical protein [Hydrogenophaga sp.]|uniref:hypothetical protein n=1 Tax=Hydrogenophaga sp. TaxID=1904254 RepID=UPI0026180154|nr:hypothetical protein [Hydrogenophaga sp.]
MTSKLSSSVDSAPAHALLQEAPLRGLIAAKVPTGITAQGRKGHFVVEIRFGDGLALLANAHDEVRSFAALSTVATFLARLGCHQFQVDTTSFEPGLVRPAQPERSAAMKAGRLPKAVIPQSKP